MLISKAQKSFSKLNLKNSLIAIVPARKGSVGVRNKNTRLINKIPLIDYTIKVLNQSNLIDLIVITTNDEKIIKYYKSHKDILVIKRSDRISNSKSSSYQYTKDVLVKLKKFYNYIPNSILIAQPTSPLRKINDINNSIRQFSLSKKKSLVSVCKAEGMRHPKDMYIINNHSNIKPYIFQKKTYETRDEYFKIYQRNGCIYIFDTQFFLRYRKVKSNNPELYIMPWIRSINIDIEDDFNIAKCLIESKIKY